MSNKLYTILDLTLKFNKSLPKILEMKNQGKLELQTQIAGVPYYKIVDE